MPREYVSHRDLGEMIGVSVSTVKEWVSSGKLKAPTHMRGKWLSWHIDEIAPVIEKLRKQRESAL